MKIRKLFSLDSIKKFIFLAVFNLFFWTQEIFAQSGELCVGDACSTGRLSNPLSNISTIDQFVEKAANILFLIAIPILGLFFIFAGFKFVSAQGNKDKLEGAKRTFLNTLIGAVLLLGAWVIAEAISGTVEQLN